MLSWIFAAYFAYWMGNSLFFIYIQDRQYEVHLQNEKRPEAFAAFITKEDYTRARNYELDLHNYRYVRSLFDLVTGAIKLLCFFMPWMWDYSGRVASSIWGGGGEIWQSIVYIVLMDLLDVALDVPFSYYRTFVIEQRHGFNRKTHLFFLKDALKELGIGLAIEIPINVLLIGLVKFTAARAYAFLYVWVFLFAVHLALETIWPVYIAPLFDNYALLPESDLKKKIEALAERVGFPLTKIYVVQNSVRSAHSNAYMYGFWKNKRIVLYDTLLSDEYNKLLKPVWDALSPTTQAGDDDGDAEARGLTDDEVLSVLGHELGHWKLWHCVYEFIAAEFYTALSMFIFSRVIHSKAIFEAFGFSSSRPVLIGYVLSSQVMAPISQLYSVFWLYVSRHIEFAADRFSAELGYVNESISAEIKLGKDNRSMPIDDWLYALFHRTHPSGPERVEALKKFL